MLKWIRDHWPLVTKRRYMTQVKLTVERDEALKFHRKYDVERAFEMQKDLDAVVAKLINVKSFDRNDYKNRFTIVTELAVEMVRRIETPTERRLVAESVGRMVAAEVNRTRFII